VFDMAKDFLLEIGVEELPARFLNPALAQLQKLTAQVLQDNRLEYGEITTCGTPRRITVFVRGVEENQQSLLQEVKGPAVKVAFNSAGEPTRAALGFASSNGVSVEELVRKSIGPVEYVFAIKQEAGRPAVEVLEKLVPSLIGGLHFPKPMRWGDLDMRFARPIRWLLCLFGDAVLPFDLSRIQADRYTYGHRFLSNGKLAIKEASDYFEVMRVAHVIVDVNERREIIRQQIIEVAAQEGGQVEIDVERPARRGHDDVGPGLQGDLAEGPHELDRRQVCLDNVAGEYPDGFACLIQHQVDGEMDLHHPGRFDHVEMDRVVQEPAGTGLGRHEHLRPVVDLDGPVAGDPREHRLPSAGETCELMGLHLPHGDPQVRFMDGPGYLDGCAV